MKGNVFRLFVLFALLQCSFAVVGANPFTVVIDPGHGGRDPGTINGRTKEKDINLSIALKVGELLKNNHPDIKVVYTRSTDVYVELNRRAEIANKLKADLFISIHSNAVRSRSVFGTETFTLGLHRSQENLEVAKRENSVILMEDNYQTRYEGFDPNSAESYIIFEMIQNTHLENSILMAAEVQKEFRTTARRADRGVRQAGLLVLRNTSMPSVLVEVGFLSNHNEAQYLRSSQGQDALSRSIYRAVIRYRHSVEKKSGTPIFAANSDSSTSSSFPSNESPTPTTNAGSEESKENSGRSTSNEALSGSTIYKIQILTHSKKLPANSKLFKGLKGVEWYKEGNLYKYTYKSSTNMAEIERERRKVLKQFKQAFIVHFKNGKRIK
ncbi:MAG: N-acetylmuramoyl-L-alanine amidase [Bacteroidales bacterium]